MSFSRRVGAADDGALDGDDPSASFGDASRRRVFSTSFATGGIWNTTHRIEVRAREEDTESVPALLSECSLSL